VLHRRPRVGDRTEDHSCEQDHRQRHFFHSRAEAAEDGGGGADRIAGLAIEKTALKELANDPDAKATHLAIEPGDVVRHGKSRGEDVLRILTRDGSHDQRRIGDRAGHRPRGIHGPDDRQEAIPAGSPPRRPHPDDATVRRRIADRSAGVLAERRRAQRGRCRDSAAGARRAGLVLRVPRVSRLPVGPVAGAEHAALRHVELAEQDRPGLAETRDRGGILIRHEVRECPRAVRRADPLCEELVLHRDGDPVERPDQVAADHGGLVCLRLFQCRIARHRHVCVQPAIPPIDALEVHAHELDRRNLSLADETDQLGDRREGEVGLDHPVFSG
jgi:hypothetical protein